MSATRLLVPVSESVSLRTTVAYVVREAHERSQAAGTGAAVHFVYPVSTRLPGGDEAEAGRVLLERVAVWAEEDLGEAGESVSVRTALVGLDEYLFSPGDYAEVLARYARRHDLEVAVFDPEYNPVGTTPLLPPLEVELRRSGLAVESAPGGRERRRARLVRRGTLEQLLALFAISYAFYLLLAGSLATFELVTGAIGAGIVAVVLWRVSLTGPVEPARTAAQLVRLVIYAPYLLWEITKANVQIAYVVLHPALPIDPEMVEFEAAVWSALPVTTLANSITLTPGTLTVDVTRRQFTVHTLTVGSRAGLLAGGLERAVRFVYYGRSATTVPSPAERGDSYGGTDDGVGGRRARATETRRLGDSYGGTDDGVGGAEGPDGTDGGARTNGTEGADATEGVDGTGGADGTDEANGENGSNGANGTGEGDGG